MSPELTTTLTFTLSATQVDPEVLASVRAALTASAQHLAASAKTCGFTVRTEEVLSKHAPLQAHVPYGRSLQEMAQQGLGIGQTGGVVFGGPTALPGIGRV